MARLTLLFCFCAALMVTGIKGDYIRMNEPCPADEKCFLYPNAQCFFECMNVDSNGNGQDCIYNFYDNGVRVGCWL